MSLLLVAGLLGSGAGQARPQQASGAEAYREAAQRIIRTAMQDDAGWQKLAHLTTHIGHRLSGSPQLEKAVQWAGEGMKAEGLENVWLQPVKVPHWVRGAGEARVIAPYEKPLDILALGGSVATPAGGITAAAVVADSFEALDAMGRERVAGKIVVFTPQWGGYGPTVQYRARGASRAAALGAVAVLVRSATGRSLYTPHTGGMIYDEALPKIPAAAITVEDSEWFRRMRDAKAELRVHLRLETQIRPDADSHNVIAEITGQEKPEEVVVLGGHMDSWDVGEGAHDDGGGVIAAWHAVTLLKQLGLRPRRTVRVVLWTNEENGLRGALAYRAWVGDKIASHVAAIEMDIGTERPTGFAFGVEGVADEKTTPQYEAAFEKLRGVMALLDEIGAGGLFRGGGGADIGPLMRDGVPGFGLRTIGEHYFDYHHTKADTLDKIKPEDLRKCTAMLAVLSYVLAEMPERLVPLSAKPAPATMPATRSRQ